MTPVGTQSIVTLPSGRGAAGLPEVVPPTKYPSETHEADLQPAIANAIVFFQTRRMTVFHECKESDAIFHTDIWEFRNLGSCRLMEGCVYEKFCKSCMKRV